MLSIEAEKQRRVVRALSAYPSEIREPPANDNEIAALAADWGPIPSQVEWFLRECGGGVVGPEHIDGVRNISESNEKFRSESGADGWTMQDVFIIGWDGWGNPIGVDRQSGAVLIEDHNFGGVHTEAPSLLDYLLKLIHRSAT